VSFTADRFTMSQRTRALGSAFFLLWALSGLASCSRSDASPAPPAKTEAKPSPPPAPSTGEPSNAIRPAPERLVAFGDLHGDLAAARAALRLAGAIDAKDAWIGGKLIVVQTGDQIDRGDDDRKILDLFERLKDEAPKSGGEVIAMLGNHEIMNASFDFRYVTPGGFTAFNDVTPRAALNGALGAVGPAERPRAAAFAPSGPYAAMLAKRPVVARVGDSLFVHGGILPKHVTFGLTQINAAAKRYLEESDPVPPKILTAEDSPLWTRAYSAAPGREECADLEKALSALGAKRLVMGHTVQRNGINPACNEKAWRIDVGMSHFYGGAPQVLEIKGDKVTVLKAP
jgi:hypothetical protein